MIRVGIVGYGNLGRSMEHAIAQNDDMELRYIFTRREPLSIKPITADVPVIATGTEFKYCDEIDVMVMCGGSANDLHTQTPQFARNFNVVDSYDIHAKIPEHYKKVNDAAKAGGKTAVISVGWDPGLFSLNRLISKAILPHGKSYTFWGRGVSQGHSAAVRSIDGVLDARQYTVPILNAIESVRSGNNPELSTRQKHKRECFVVAKNDADLMKVEQEIVAMPDYFADYDTSVYFISKEELENKHLTLPHGGFVIHSGKTGDNNESNQVIEFSLKLDSNPEFTANVLAAYARAAYRLNSEGTVGCKTIYDIAPSYLCAESNDVIIRMYL